MALHNDTSTAPVTATGVNPTPFNLIHGQWYLGTEPLPNQAQLDTLEHKLAQIESLHQEGKVPENGFNQGFDMRWCERDHEPWPCRTIRIIRDENG